MHPPFLQEGNTFRFLRDGDLWTINKQFKSGAFGEVYRIVNKKNEERALKLELNRSTGGPHLWLVFLIFNLFNFL